ncbi:AraC family transcriptional regulator ligand-binding domain-containing protein [Aliiruegeria lutimaris]|uniref:Arabinose-binding domain of AraC transcription regulator, N-term n=1 Tax=Aliiruegeria lutimaris TaxID=571298 RepID=A0A1G8J013_9RHOB|nr:AraC family transcriptional regulator ligand-binding domain-containing protein [Aliiruegeria lutimaris]SDI24050.1 Arabinose-binding domain of AraC transcription regulator, N-term [Aliiruegeria lutimaris]
MTDLQHKPVRLQQLIAQMERQGHPARKILHQAGLCAAELDADRTSLPFRKVVAIWKNVARATGDDLFGPHFAKQETAPIPTPLFCHVQPHFYGPFPSRVSGTGGRIPSA